jgi:hypothetical protein
MDCDITESEIFVSDPNFCYLQNVKVGKNSTVILNDSDTLEDAYVSCGLYDGTIGSNTILAMKADPFYEFFSSLDNGASFLRDFSIADNINITIPAGKIYQNAHITKTESTFKDVIDVTLDEWESGYVLDKNGRIEAYTPLGGYLDFNRQFKQEDFDYNISYLGDIALNFPLTTFPRFDGLEITNFYNITYYITSFVNYNKYFNQLTNTWEQIDGKGISTTFRNTNIGEVDNRKKEFTELSELPIYDESNTRFIEEYNFLIEEDPRIVNIDFVTTVENPYYDWIKSRTPKIGGNNFAWFEAQRPGWLMLSNNIEFIIRDSNNPELSILTRRGISESYVTFKINNYKYLGLYENNVTGAIFKNGMGYLDFDADVEYNPIRFPEYNLPLEYCGSECGSLCPIPSTFVYVPEGCMPFPGIGCRVWEDVNGTIPFNGNIYVPSIGSVVSVVDGVVTNINPCEIEF